MADDNVSFTDAADGTGAGGAKANANASGMLDLIGNLNDKKGGDKSGKGGKGGKKGKKGKGGKGGKGGKKVRKQDKFESQNFLFRIEGSICCASIVVGLAFMLLYIVAFIGFLVKTNAKFMSYMDAPWGGDK